MIYDIAIVGGGPAGLSAALTSLQRNKSVVLFEPYGFSPRLSKAEKIDNYLGLPNISGKELMDVFLKHVNNNSNIEIIEKKVLNIFPENDFTLMVADEVVTSKTVIFAPGAALQTSLKGEENFLGRGVSYCATCDGQLFKDKEIAIISNLAEAEEEIIFLSELCSKILFFQQYKGKSLSLPNIQTLKEKPLEIIGNDTVSKIITDKNHYNVDGVFIFRNNDPPQQIIPDLIVEDNFIKTDNQMKTNIPGFFAAGDIVGRPWQISKATGEGLVAALSAITYLANK